MTHEGSNGTASDDQRLRDAEKVMVWIMTNISNGKIAGDCWPRLYTAAERFLSQKEVGDV